MIYEFLKFFTIVILAFLVKFTVVIIIPSFFLSQALYEIGFQVSVSTISKILAALWLFSYCYKSEYKLKVDKE